MLTTLAIILFLSIFALLGYAAIKPDTFRVERALGIAAPAEKIFALINDFHQWSAWSPFEKMDPAMKKNFSGAAAGTGAVYEWEGNAKAGKGRIEITEAAPSSKITMKLDMFKPFPANNLVVFTLEPQRDETYVTWVMQGPQSFMAKVMGVLMNCDKMVGGQFEEGLARLKSIVEKQTPNA